MAPNPTAQTPGDILLFLPASLFFYSHHSTSLKMSRYRLLHLLFASAASVAALSDCYLPNGTAFPLSAAYEPCIATENVFSMCCVLNVTALVALRLSAGNLDTCLPNGMCQPPAGVGGFTRDLCTDPTWKSPNCLNVCVGGSVSYRLGNTN